MYRSSIQKIHYKPSTFHWFCAEANNSSEDQDVCETRTEDSDFLKYTAAITIAQVTMETRRGVSRQPSALGANNFALFATPRSSARNIVAALSPVDLPQMSGMFKSLDRVADLQSGSNVCSTPSNLPSAVSTGWARSTPGAAWSRADRSAGVQSILSQGGASTTLLSGTMTAGYLACIGSSRRPEGEGMAALNNSSAGGEGQAGGMVHSRGSRSAGQQQLQGWMPMTTGHTSSSTGHGSSSQCLLVDTLMPLRQASKKGIVLMNNGNIGRASMELCAERRYSSRTCGFT